MFLPQLPVTLVFGRPSRVELLGLSGCALVVVSAVVWAHTAAQQPPSAPAEPPTRTAPLEITSWPDGADLSIDGQPRGTTPATVAVVPGRHDVVLQAQDAIAETRIVDVDAHGSSLALSVWRAHPSVTYLKPPLPGAQLSDATFVSDGRLVLQASLPDGERQAWTLDPAAHLASQRLGDVASHAPLAVRPDGQIIAVLQPRTEPARAASSLAFSDHVPGGEVWLVPTDSKARPRRVWTAAEPSEELVDLTWAPDEKHLILVSRQPTGSPIGGGRTVIHWLDTDSGQAEDLALLPSQVAPGTYVWSPDGRSVAFVVHTASLAAVCTLTVAGGFRYLGDLGHDGLLAPPVAPVAWAPDGRVLYGALVSQAPTAGSASPINQNAAGLFLADPPDAPGRPFSTTQALAPLWRQDGRILALGLPNGQDSGLRLRDLDMQGNARDVATIEVPAPGPTAYGVRWDLAHRRALIATNRASGDGPAHDYWLVDFGWEYGP
jgi:PEGA domain